MELRVVKKNRKLVLERKMRNALFALMAVCTVAGTSSGPADATEFPYCLQGRGVGIPRNCQYRSYPECMVAGSPPTNSIRSFQGHELGIVGFFVDAAPIVAHYATKQHRHLRASAFCRVRGRREHLLNERIHSHIERVLQPAQSVMLSALRHISNQVPALFMS